MTGTLNMEVIDELLALSDDGDPELLVDLIEMYLADGPTKLEAIERGIAAGDWESVERAAHSLKGSSGNLGATYVLATSDRIQNACREHKTSTVPADAKALAQYLKDAEAALRGVLSRLH